MALLPPAFLDMVVAIGIRTAPDEVRWTATGFLYGQHTDDLEDGRRRYRVYLVTNRHVMAGQRGIVLRFNPAGDGAEMQDFDIPLARGKGRWFGHPDPAIDVAVMSINTAALDARGCRFAVFGSDQHVMRRKNAIDQELSEGDGVFVLGFPMGQVGDGRMYATVKAGCVARVRDWLAGHSREFLVDVAVFPGNSGGPVVSKPELSSIKGTKHNESARLIGLVARYVAYQDVAVSQQTDRARIVFEENSGLAAVVPVDLVEEAIRSAESKLARSRRRLVRRQRAKDATSHPVA